MKNIIYGLIEEKYILPDNTRFSYGIAAYSITGTIDPPIIIAVIHDITENKEKLTHLVNSCNLLELSIEHFYDVVEDFLAN